MALRIWRVSDLDRGCGPMGNNLDHTYYAGMLAGELKPAKQPSLKVAVAAAEYDRARVEAARWKDEAENRRRELVLLIGEHVGVGDLVTYASAAPVGRFGAQRFKEDEPDTYDRYMEYPPRRLVKVKRKACDSFISKNTG